MTGEISKIFTALIFLITQIWSQSGWFVQSPLPTGKSLLSVDFINAATGVAVGVDGIILRTINSGVSWEQINTPFNNTLNCVDLFNNTLGFAVGKNGTILKTTNLGMNWQLCNGAYGNLRSVSIPEINTVYIVNDSVKIFKSTNGGSSWSSTEIPEVYLRSVFFTSGTSGYTTGLFANESRIYKTINGGINWTLQFSDTSQYFNSFYFLDNNRGYAAGGKLSYPLPGSIMMTTNGGTNWEYKLFNSPYSFTSIYFINNTTGFAAGDTSDFAYGKSIILKTTNEGINWLRYNINTYYPINSIVFNSGNLGICVGQDGYILKTTDIGNNWISMNNGTTYWLNSISIVDSNNGFASGSLLLRTSNGGLNWRVLETGFGDHFFSSIYFADPLTGYASGSEGTIIKTTNSGNNWVSQLSLGWVYRFWSSYFINSYTGYAAGEIQGTNKGFYAFTSNGGVNWNVQIPSWLSFIKSIYFYNTSTGYMAGSYGMIYKTTNQGISWDTTEILFPSIVFESIYFLNANTGYATGGYGIVIKTTNGGNNWSILIPGGPFNLKSLFFNDINTGYAVGWGGKIIKTINGGMNWINQVSLTGSKLNSVYFINNNTGYIVGDSGLILKTTSGGTPIGIIPVLHEVPKSYSLSQNFPNPFNPLTRIKFDITRSSLTKLVIYDIPGREIAILVAEQLKPGTYEVEWDASNFSSGVYFYKLITETYTNTKRMVVIK